MFVLWRVVMAVATALKERQQIVLFFLKKNKNKKRPISKPKVSAGSLGGGYG